MKLKKYIEQFDKALVKEVSAAGAAASFVGTAGQDIDQRFAGPFHPDFGELENLLQFQIDDKIAKILYSDQITPLTDQDFVDMEFDYKYDDPMEPDTRDFINKSETNMKKVGIEYKYDKNEPRYNKDDFINKSNTNWKYIK